MPYFTTCYLNNVTMILSAAWEIPNLFPQSEPAQISSINLSCPTLWKTSHNHCIFWVTVVLWFCIVCSCFNVLTSHVQSSIELLYPINHYCITNHKGRSLTTWTITVPAFLPAAVAAAVCLSRLFQRCALSTVSSCSSDVRQLPNHKLQSNRETSGLCKVPI